MDLVLEKIVINKNGLKGEVSLRYNLLTINKIFVDVTNTISPVAIPKFEKTYIFSGSLINDIKEDILTFFQETLQGEDGIFEIEYKFEATINKLD